MAVKQAVKLVPEKFILNEKHKIATIKTKFATLAEN